MNSLWRIFIGAVLVLLIAGCVHAEPAAAAVAGFEAYVGTVEARLARQRRSGDGWMGAAVCTPENEARLRRGEFVLERVREPGVSEYLAGAMLHHWRGTAFAAGASAADFGRVMKDFAGYPVYFAPQVLRASATVGQSDTMQVQMRVRQRHGITVVMDMAYAVDFVRIDSKRGYSVSRSSKVAEVASAGTSGERALDAREEHGFLWRLHTYWSYEERDGGLYVQMESVSLTRAIPRGLGWAVGPFVESVPRESLEFMLRAACVAFLKSRKS